MSNLDSLYDVIIIGGACAGYTAGVYAGRANLKVLLFDGWQPGGQLTTTTVIENFPGFRDGIDGNKLVQEMRAQAQRFGVEIKPGDVTKVDFESGSPFSVFQNDTEYKAKAVIVATGAKARTLGIPSEQKLWAKGVSTCATCDGFFFRGKTVVVIGGGDSAMEEAMFLTRFASKVYLIHRREEFRASKIMLDRTKANEKIEMLTNKTVDEVLGDAHVTGLRLKDAVSGEASEIATDAMFLAIGHDPATQFLAGQITLDDHGYIQQTKHSMTSVPGVFAAGDCVDSRYRQAITAAGMGCQAAMDAERWLENL